MLTHLVLPFGLESALSFHIFVFKYLFYTGYVFVVHLCLMRVLLFESLVFYERESANCTYLPRLFGVWANNGSHVFA